VDGRSPLEYLSEVERQRQREIVLALMPAPPPRLLDLFDVFAARLGA
jgi:hypothetical protein